MFATVVYEFLEHQNGQLLSRLTEHKLHLHTEEMIVLIKQIFAMVAN